MSIQLNLTDLKNTLKKDTQIGFVSTGTGLIRQSIDGDNVLINQG